MQARMLHIGELPHAAAVSARPWCSRLRWSDVAAGPALVRPHVARFTTEGGAREKSLEHYKRARTLFREVPAPPPEPPTWFESFSKEVEAALAADPTHVRALRRMYDGEGPTALLVLKVNRWTRMF